MNTIIVLSWVFWAMSIYQRRSHDPKYREKWHQDFCRRQRQKAGMN
jgi:hypothetical protein